MNDQAFCQQCGSARVAGAAFCGTCGREWDPEVATSPEPDAAEPSPASTVATTAPTKVDRGPVLNFWTGLPAAGKFIVGMLLGVIAVGVALGVMTRGSGVIGTVVPILGSHDLTGTFVLTDSGVEYSSADCHGTGGYSDIKEGQDVIVKDGASKIIGTSNTIYDASSSSGGRCAFTFTVPDVPKADFYSIEVGHRGALTYSWAEMVGQSWSVGFTLGG